MKKESATPRLRWSLLLACAAAVVLLLINEANWRRSSSALQEVQSAQHMRIGIGRLMRAAIDAETGQRGYLLTGDSVYLAPYRNANGEMDEVLASLEATLDLHPEDRADFERLRHFLTLKRGEMELTLRLREQGRDAAWQFVMSSDVGEQHMQQVRLHAERLIAAGNAHIEQAFEQIDQSLLYSRVSMAGMVALSLLAFMLYLRQSDALLQRSLGERDRLEALVSERTASLRELATHLQQVREDERGYLARELHDELGALLTAAKLDVARLKSRLDPGVQDLHTRLSHLTQTLNQGIALKRRIVEDLRPSALSHLGLVAALDILAREFSQRLELPVQSELEEVSLPETLQIAVYRLVQEAFTNIGKYARAHHVHLRLFRDGSMLCVQVEDDGQGFDPQRVGHGHHGLAGMRHRVEGLGGRLEVHSRPGKGTCIDAYLPLAQPEPAPAAQAQPVG